MVTFTYPELGNTGVNSDDQEADQPHARGVIARQLAPLHSNWRSQDSLEEWMRSHQVVGIAGVDTRALVRHLREGGAMNGVICSDGRQPHELIDLVRDAPSMEGLNLANAVSTRSTYTWTDPCRVVLTSGFVLEETPLLIGLWLWTSASSARFWIAWWPMAAGDRCSSRQ